MNGIIQIGSSPIPPIIIDDKLVISTFRPSIEVYNAETTPVLGFYRERGLLVDIAGDKNVDEVNKQVINVLGT